MNCMFSGETADSQEHVTPKWLQRKFDLWDRSIIIPNGTELPYRELTVPVASAHNNRFAVIEESIVGGTPTDEEVYLWALKIHIGLIYRDASLKFDRSLASSPTILNVGDFATEVLLFRLLYDVWANGGSTNPSPFGGVFVLDSLLGPDDFDLFHCLVTGTVGINIGKKFIVIFLWDQGDSKKSNIQRQWDNWHSKLPGFDGKSDRLQYAYMAHHAWACESAYWLYRQRRPLTFFRAGNQLVVLSPTSRPTGKPPVENEYRQVCKSFGLDLVHYGAETGNTYLGRLPHQ